MALDSTIGTVMRKTATSSYLETVPDPGSDPRPDGSVGPSLSSWSSQHGAHSCVAFAAALRACDECVVAQLCYQLAHSPIAGLCMPWVHVLRLSVLMQPTHTSD